MDKTYTAEQLVKKYAGKYIKTYATYDYQNQQWIYAVRGVKGKIWENFNLPEDCLIID